MFKDTWYWTSTEFQTFPVYSLVQFFSNGNQHCIEKPRVGNVKAVRRELIV